MSLYEYVIIQGGMNKSEIEIHNLFNHYAKELYYRKWDMSQEINNWGNLLIRQIEAHVREQNRRLDEEYGKLEHNIKDTRRQFINAAWPHEQRRDNEQIRQLLEQCNAVKFELAAFEFPDRTIPFIEFMTEEQLTQKKRDERDAQRIEAKSRNNAGGNYGNSNANNTGARGGSPPKTTLPTSKQPDRQISITKSANTHDGSTSNNDSQNLHVKNDDKSDNKCFVCFMIFPVNMESRDRQQHINEHFKED